MMRMLRSLAATVILIAGLSGQSWLVLAGEKDVKELEEVSDAEKIKWARATKVSVTDAIKTATAHTPGRSSKPLSIRLRAGCYSKSRLSPKMGKWSNCMWTHRQENWLNWETESEAYTKSLEPSDTSFPDQLGGRPSALGRKRLGSKQDREGLSRPRD